MSVVSPMRHGRTARSLSLQHLLSRKGDDGSVEALLDAAEDILNDVAPSVMQELAEERERSERGGNVSTHISTSR